MTEIHSPKILYCNHKVNVDRERCTMVVSMFRGNIRADVFGGESKYPPFYDISADFRIVQ